MKNLSEWEITKIVDFYTKEGKSVQQIARELRISIPTIKKYIEEKSMLSHDELILYFLVVKYLRNVGKIKITPENKDYVFNLSDKELWLIADEIADKLNEDCSNIKELTEFYKNKLLP
jgi:hypothetical protein